MRWPRVAKISLTLTVLASIAIGAPVCIAWIRAELLRRDQAPSPVLATPQETINILVAVFAQLEFIGVPPPPPEDGQSPPGEPVRTLILSDHSLCIDQTVRRSDCGIESSDLFTGPELDSLAPRKFRQELVLANQESRPINLAGIPNTRVVDSAEVNKILTEGWWKEFYLKFPGTSGYSQIGRPVLTPDRQSALVYITLHCDGLCGAGVIYLLSHERTGWRVVKQETLWIS